jgi:ClpA/ClpB-like protein
MVGWDLIDEVQRSSPSPDPLDFLASAIAKSDELTADADALVDHFVAEARHAGHSWTVIGERLGVSKQAVRERFGGRATHAGRERFMPRLQQCVTAAGTLARRQGSSEISLAHLIVGLASNEGMASNALHRLGVTPEGLTRAAGLSESVPSQLSVTPPPESDAFTRALRSAAWFAAEQGHDYIGTEHVLFVLATDPGSSVRRILEELGVQAADVKRELSQCVGGRAKKRRRRDRRNCNCSFCGTPNVLLFGHGVRICQDCARLALELNTLQAGDP